VPETKFVKFEDVTVPEVRANSRLTEEQQAFFNATVETFGVIQDPLVRPLEGGKYELMAGRTRINEMRERGADGMDMKIIEASEETALFMHLAENVARGDVDPVSVARVIRRMVELEISVPDIAKKLGRSDSWVRRTHRLLELPEQYQAALTEGVITPTHVDLVLRMPTPYEVDQAMQTAIRLRWNTATTRVYVENRLYQLEAAKTRALDTGEQVEAPAPEPEALIRYQQCLTCGYQVPREKISVQLICEACRTLIKYIVDQVGPPEEAITQVYQALLALHRQPAREGPPERPPGGEPDLR